MARVLEFTNVAIRKMYAEIRPQLDNINREINIKRAEIDALQLQKAELKATIDEFNKVEYDTVIRPVVVEPIVEG
jgi:predicted  nucleic acid-binding Zn-ribbon protein